MIIPWKRLKAPLKVRQASGDVHWRTKADGWQLDVTNLLVGLSGPVWSADRLRIVRGRDENIIRARHVNLSDVTALVTELNEDHVWLKRWTALKPAGLLEHIKVQVTGPWDNPEDFSIAANIKELSVRPYDKYPGVERLSAYLVAGREAGELKLNAKDPVLLMPQLFRGPLAARRVNGVVQWEKTADHWRVMSDDLHLQSDDGIANGSLDLHIPFDTAVSPYLKVQADFRDGNGAHAARYFPVKRLKPKTLAWMESAFVSGRIVSGQLIFDGRVRDFPFAEAPGKFEIRVHVRDGVYRYLRGWRPISEAEVDVAINGEMVLITGHGKIGDLNVKDVSVAVRPPSDGKARPVYIRGRLHGPVNEAITVLREARSEESAKWTPYLPADLQGLGEGQLALEVDLPVATPRKPVLRGLYSFANAGFMLTDLRLAADTLAGQIRFTQRGLEEGEVRGRFQGGDMLFSAERGTNGLLRIHSSGRLESPKLLAARPKIAQAVSGSVDWSVSWRERIGLGDLYIATDLRDIKASLPSPLARPRGLGLGKLFIQTETSRPDLQTLVIKGGDAIRGRLTFARTKSVWGFTRGHINLGRPRANVPQGLGLAVNADMDTLDVDRWLPLLGEDAGVRATSKVLTRLSADIRRLNMFNRQFGRASIDIMRAADGWRGIVDGDAATGSGTVSMGSGKPMLIQLDLARLSLPDKENRGTDTAVEVTKLPAVEVRSKYFIVKDKQLGELDFAAVPGTQGWRIKRFNLTRPDMTLAVNGWWRVISGRHTSDFNIAFNSSDMGKTLAAFGMPDQVAGGEVEIKSLLSWAGSPANPRLAALNGNVDIVAEKGRFVRVASGAGRLFGLLDLRSIGRYLTLDFSPIFGKGFIYDRISGQVTIERGNAYTNDLLINGPSATLEVDGRVGLAAEDFDLTLAVNPKLSNTLTLTSWGLFGPGVAVAVFAFQKIFKKQIAAGTRVTYIVKGPWDTPAITRLARPRAAEDNASTPGEASTP